MINIVVTSKPVDGLLYYSYEYCDLLNKAGHDAQVLIISHRKFQHEDYINTIKRKYVCLIESLKIGNPKAIPKWLIVIKPKKINPYITRA